MLIKTKNTLPIIIALIMTMAIPGISFAKVGPPVIPDCTESVFPFNINGVLPQGNTAQYLSNFSEAVCKQHAPYPGPHVAITSAAENNYQVAAAATKDNITSPTTDHIHTYVNNSIEDNYIYKTYLAAFEITLQSDAYENTDLSQLQCPVFANQSVGSTTYNNFWHCVNGAYDSNVFGGTRLTRKDITKTENGKTVHNVTLRWDFAQENPSLKPWFSGVNANVDIGDNPEIFNFDTSNEDNRSDTYIVRLVSKNNSPKTIWTGTTTSRVLVRDAVLPYSQRWNYQHQCGEPGYDKNNSWCFVEPTDASIYPNMNTADIEQVLNVQQNKKYDYYWVPVGTVSTVWKTPAAPSTCSALELTSSTPLTSSNGQLQLPANTSTTFKVTPQFSNGPISLKYKWSATKGTFKEYNAIGNGTNPYTSGSSTTSVSTFFSGADSGTITVQALGPNNETYSACQKTIQILPPPPEKTCNNLDIAVKPPVTFGTDSNGTKTLKKNTPATFTVTPSFVGSGEEPQLDYTWDASALTTVMPLTIPNPVGSSTGSLQIQGTTNLGNISQFGQNNVLLAAAGSSIPSSSISTPNASVSQTATQNALSSASVNNYGSFQGIGSFNNWAVGISALKYGQFKDNINDSDDNLANPYTDSTESCIGWFCSDDREIYYTGGQPGTLIHVTGFKKGNPSQDYQGACSASVIIPYETNACIGLAISPDKLEANKETTFTVTPTFEDPTSPVKLNYYWQATSQNPTQSSSISPGLSGALQIPGINNGLSQLGNNNQSGSQSGNSQIVIPNVSANNFGNLVETGTQNVNTQALKPGLVMEEIQIPGPKPVINPVNELTTLGQMNIFNADNTAQPPTNNLVALASSALPPSATMPGTYQTLGTGSSASSVTNTGNIFTPNQSLIELLGFGLFADDNTKQDLDNPYLETKTNAQQVAQTYYTGGKSGTWITVTGQDQHGNDFPKCTAQLQIPETPAKKCLQIKPLVQNAAGGLISLSEMKAGETYSISLDQNNSIYNDKDKTKIEKYNISVVNQKGHGALSANNPSSSCPTVTQLMNLPSTAAWVIGAANTCTYTYTPKAGDVITIKATNDDGVAACSVTATIPQTPQTSCDDSKFNVQPPVTTLGAGQPQIFTATGLYKDGTPVTQIHWKTTEGYFQGMGLCSSQAGSDLILSSNCAVSFMGASAGNLITVSAYPEEAGICQRNINIVSTSTPYCSSLQLSPYSLPDNGQSYNYNAHVYWSDGQTYDTTVNWSSDNGTATQSHSSSQDYNYGYTRNNNNGFLDVKVTNTPAGTLGDQYGLCSRHLSASVTPNKCDDMRIYDTDNDNSNGFCVETSPHDYENYLSWSIPSGIDYSLYNNNRCIRIYNLPSTSQTIRVRVPGESCEQSITIQKRKRPPEQPEFEKGVRIVSPRAVLNKLSGYNYYKTVTPNLNEKNPEFEFKLTFTSHANNTSAVITDPAFKNGVIQGILLPNSSSALQGSLTLMPETVRVNNIGECPSKGTQTNCYIAPADILNGITLKNLNAEQVVEITYRARISYSQILNDPTICEKGEICEEYFKNLGHAEWNISGSSGTYSDSGWLEDSTRIQLFCQYILSRAAGDIFLENDLNYGIDINKCTPYKSGTGVIITPTTPDTPKLSSEGTPIVNKIFQIGHEVCTTGQAGKLDTDLNKLYGKDVSQLSSQICEVKLQPGNPWQQEIIANSIKENITRVARWDAIEGNQSLNILLNDSQYKDNKVFRVNGNLSVDQAIEFGSGAKTFIVENGDLVIKGNLTYKTENLQINSVKDIPSVAFIVLNGRVYVDKNVTNLVGVYYVQEGDKEVTTGDNKYRTDSGKLFSGSPSNKNDISNKPLTVEGSVYGDIQPLFKDRQYAGEPGKENQAAITIRFDQRIMLNTPPALRDIISVSETQVAR